VLADAICPPGGAVWLEGGEAGAVEPGAVVGLGAGSISAWMHGLQKQLEGGT